MQPMHKSHPLQGPWSCLPQCHQHRFVIWAMKLVKTAESHIALWSCCRICHKSATEHGEDPKRLANTHMWKSNSNWLKKCPVLAEQLENPSHVCSQMLSSWALPLRLFCHDGIGALRSNFFFLQGDPSSTKTLNPMLKFKVTAVSG